MENNGSFLFDMFDTLQSMPDWIKMAWVLMPSLTFIAALALVLNYRIRRMEAQWQKEDEAAFRTARNLGVHMLPDDALVGIVYKTSDGLFRIRQLTDGGEIEGRELEALPKG
ncbi:hypothetical protein [Coralliovum pocilloporae]|uniref:hypothetical protein n=1 Tax=Coralliovum pocilloporae TaxID=3066369 RepID=UPI00330774AA